MCWKPVRWKCKAVALRSTARFGVGIDQIIITILALVRANSCPALGSGVEEGTEPCGRTPVLAEAADTV